MKRRRRVPLDARPASHGGLAVPEALDPTGLWVRVTLKFKGERVRRTHDAFLRFTQPVVRGVQ